MHLKVDEKSHLFFFLVISKEIQTGGSSGHDPCEDALAALDLVLHHLQKGRWSVATRSVWLAYEICGSKILSCCMYVPVCVFGIVSTVFFFFSVFVFWHTVANRCVHIWVIALWQKYCICQFEFCSGLDLCVFFRIFRWLMWVFPVRHRCSWLPGKNCLQIDLLCAEWHVRL